MIEPFNHGFMREALAMALIVAVPAAVLSCFIVLKGWSLIGDAISHAVLPGLVLAHLAGWPLLVGAFAAGVTCTTLAGWIEANSRIKSDTALGVVMSGLFGLGLVLFVATPTELHLDHILFGNILALSGGDFAVAGAIATGVLAVLALTWRDQAMLAFDPVQARVMGLRTGWLHHGMLAMIAASVVAMLAAVGIILAVALLIAPGATAFLLVRRLGAMIAVAVAVALGACVAGLWISFHVDAAPAPTIVLVLTAAFIAAFARAQRS